MNPYQSPQSDDRTRRGRVRRDYVLAAGNLLYGIVLSAIAVSIVFDGAEGVGGYDVPLFVGLVGAFFIGVGLVLFVIEDSRHDG